MGIELMDIGVKVRKGVIFTIRGCFRSVCNHPFLVGMLCFLFFLYRTSPFIFSLLVSTSPVLICTAILLGILLSFGQPELPEIEIEERISDEFVLTKTGVSGDATGIDTNKSNHVEGYGEKRRGEEELSTEERSLPAGKHTEIHRTDSSDSIAPLIEESLRDLENGEINVAKRELGDVRLKQKAEWNDEGFSDREALDHYYSSIPNLEDKNFESDDEKSDVDSFDSEMVNVDSLDSPPRSPWKRMEDREEEEEQRTVGDEEEDEGEEEEEDDALDSGSDRAESSSPDASMADIMPMLDELHPLLDEDIPQTVPMSRDGSDAGSERSVESSTSSESDDDNEDGEDVADDDNEDGEDEEDKPDAKEEQTKSAIIWTEEDQKNLMDLGSSEMERNQRLENLILRRRARKNMSMVPERNLIDLESSDLPFNLAPISTTRQNPFDLPHDSYDNSGLPPIPGSAPSILLPRRNPFDIPYDSGEEKPNLVGEGFQEELPTFQPREPLFRRHESFNVGPSIFAPNRQERQYVKMRPYFVPERMVSEESSYSPIQRQSSELSDSKVSSVPETESIGSVGDLEDRKLAEEDNPQELESTPRVNEVAEDSPDSPSRDHELNNKRDDLAQEDTPHESTGFSGMEHVSEHVGHGSQSSEEEEESVESGQDEKGDTEVDKLDLHLGETEGHDEEEIADQLVEVQATLYSSNSVAHKQMYSRDSSSSSLSEVSERVFTEQEGGDLSTLDGRNDDFSEEQGNFAQASVGSANLTVTITSNDDNPHWEPVYDSSPPAVRKNLSSSSISPGVHAESDLGFPSLFVKRSVSFVEREPEGSNQESEKDTCSDIEMLSESSVVNPVDDHLSGPTDVPNKRHPDSANTIFPEVDRMNEGTSAVPGATSLTSVVLKPSAEASVEESPMEHSTQDQISSSISDKNANDLAKASEAQNLDQSADDKHSLVSKRDVIVEPSAQQLEGQSTSECSIEKEETIQTAENQSQSPSSDTDVYVEAYEKLISTPSAEEGAISFFSDRSMQEHTLKNLNEVAAVQLPTLQVLNMPEVQELDNDFTSNVNSPLSPDFISIPSSTSETASPHVDLQTTIEEVDEIKEIDEGILSELDGIGDFSVKVWESTSNDSEEHRDSVREDILTRICDAETGTITITEVNSSEANNLENASYSENSREEIDVCEDNMEPSDLQTSGTSMAEHIDIPNKEYNERDGQDSPEPEISEHVLSKGNETSSSHSVESDNYEDKNSRIPVVEVHSVQDVGFVPKKAELKGQETEIIVDDAEVSHQRRVNTDTSSEMSQREVREPEDTDLASEKTSDGESREPVVLQPAQAELVVREILTGKSEAEKLQGGSNTMNISHDSPVVEVRSTENPTVENEVSAIEIGRLSDDQILHVPDSTETDQTSSELHVTETSEGTYLFPKEALDINKEEPPKPTLDDGAEELPEDKPRSSVDKEPHAKEISVIVADKPADKFETLEDLHSTTSKADKGKTSESSSSSSRSSSDSGSSSSDSEVEKE